MATKLDITTDIPEQYRTLATRISRDDDLGDPTGCGLHLVGEVEIEEEEEEEINQLYLIERRIEAMEKTLKRIERKLGDDD